MALPNLAQVPKVLPSLISMQATDKLHPRTVSKPLGRSANDHDGLGCAMLPSSAAPGTTSTHMAAAEALLMDLDEQPPMLSDGQRPRHHPAALAIPSIEALNANRAQVSESTAAVVAATGMHEEEAPADRLLQLADVAEADGTLWEPASMAVLPAPSAAGQPTDPSQSPVVSREQGLKQWPSVGVTLQHQQLGMRALLAATDAMAQPTALPAGRLDTSAAETAVTGTDVPAVPSAAVGAVEHGTGEVQAVAASDSEHMPTVTNLPKTAGSLGSVRQVR
jgi:hypothetical protein